MKIYRVEDADQEGMYTRGENKPSTLIDLEQYAQTHHPAPREDKQLKYACGKSIDLYDLNDDNLFGFRSLDQVEEWINQGRWVDDLHEKGFHLVEIEIPSRYVYIGDSQLIFLNSKVESRVKHCILEVLCENNESLS